MKIICIAILLFCSSLQGEILPSTTIDDVETHLEEGALILLNLAEVVLDTPTMLGSQAWRKYVRSRVEPAVHDALTLYVAKHVPFVLPENQTGALIARLQNEKRAVLGFTSRGRNEWYGTYVPDVDLMTKAWLQQVKVDFSQTELPVEWSHLQQDFSAYFHDGIIYTTNTLEKGELLASMLTSAHYSPSKIILVDDKIESLKSVEAHLQKLDVPFVGLAYSRPHPPFDPCTAHVQLIFWLMMGELLSDQEAFMAGLNYYPDMEPESFFKALVDLVLVNEN